MQPTSLRTKNMNLGFICSSGIQINKEDKYQLHAVEKQINCEKKESWCQFVPCWLHKKLALVIIERTIKTDTNNYFLGSQSCLEFWHSAVGKLRSGAGFVTSGDDD